MPELPVTPEATPAPVEGSTPAPIAEETKTYTVNGKEYKVPLSKIDERVQKSFGAEEAMKTSAELQKAFNAFVSQAQNPEQLLGLLNHPSMKYDEEKQEALVRSMLNSKKPRIINAVKEWIYKNEIEPKTMDPKDLKLRELEAYKAEQEANHKKSTEEKEEAERQAATNKAFNDYRIAIGKEIKANGLPETEATVARVARYALLYRKAGKEIDMADCAKRVRADIIAEANERYTSATEDNILDLLPEGMADRINKALLKRLKTKDVPAEKIEGVEPSTSKASTAEETRKMMRDLERGKKVY